MNEESESFLYFYNNQEAEKEIKYALAWAQNYELGSSSNSSYLSSYMIASLVYLFQTANEFPNTIGKALCEVFNVYNQHEAKNFLNSFRFSNDSIYHVFENWKRTSEIPVVFSLQLLCGAYDVLHAAALKDDLDMVKWLLELNIDVDKKDSVGKTAIYVAATAGKKRIIQCLLNFGASLFSLNKEHHTSLEAALFNEKIEVVELLKPDLFCNLRMNDGDTFFMRLIRQDQVSQVKHMIRYADFSVLNFSEQNVLHVCALSGHAKVIGILLNEIPSEIIDAKDVFNQTPLFLAICQKKYMMVKKLLEAGAEVTPEMLYLNNNSDIRELLQYKH